MIAIVASTPTWNEPAELLERCTGSTAGAVDWHLWGNGDMQVCDAEDTFRCVCCYVPPPPK